MTRRQNDRGGERYRDLHLLARSRPLTAGLQTDVVHHSVAHHEVCTEKVDAHRGVVRHALNANAAPIKLAFDITALLIVVIAFILLWIGILNDLFYGRSYSAGLGKLSIPVCG